MKYLEQFIAKKRLQVTDNTDTCPQQSELSVMSALCQGSLKEKEISEHQKCADDLPTELTASPPGTQVSVVSVTPKPVFEETESMKHPKWGDSQYVQISDVHQSPLQTPTAGEDEISSNPILIIFQSQAEEETTISQLATILNKFVAVSNWTLSDRSSMSETYTPVAVRLAAAGGLNVGEVLEELAALCWAKRKISIAEIEAHSPNDLPDEIVQGIVDAVRQVSIADQQNWWQELSKWLLAEDEKVHAWRCHAYDALATAWEAAAS